MIADKNQPREDLFYRENMINIVCVGTNEANAVELAQLITGSMIMWKGYWIRENYEEDFRLISYTRWPNNPKGLPTTIYADSMIVDVENFEEFKLVEQYVRARGRIPQIILYSNSDLSHLEETFRHHNAKWVNKLEVKGAKLRELIVEHYHNLNILIRETFDKIDANHNGFIEKNEIKSAAALLGENITSEEFDQCFQVMDANHDNVISFQEFINWWKLGRQNSSLMKKLIQLEMTTSSLHNSEKLNELKLELDELKDQNSLSNNFIKLFSSEVENPGFQIYFNFIKGNDRLEYVRKHLLSYQPHALTEHARWIDLSFHFDESINKMEALQTLREVKKRLFEQFEQFDPNSHEILTRLFIFEYYKYYDKNSVVIRMRNKADTQQHIDHSLFSLIQLLKSITTSQKLSLDFRIESKFG
jgi:hypothetical protein